MLHSYHFFRVQLETAESWENPERTVVRDSQGWQDDQDLTVNAVNKEQLEWKENVDSKEATEKT